MDNTTFHRISKALSDPRRFTILELIGAAAEVPCQQLSGDLPISKATLSHHLQELEAAGLIAMRKDGKFAYLSAVRPVLDDYCAELKKRVGEPASQAV